MNMKKILPIIIAVIVTGSVAFYGGMKYQTSKTPTGLAGANFQKQMFSGQNGQQNGAARRIGGTGGANMAAGEIIARDAQNITVKLQDGGSKIIFFSDSTKITKSANGTINDIEIGQTVMAGGKQNTDGSLTAETLQIGKK